MRLFSTEQVSKYHPDKYADQISDAILTEILKHDKQAKVACEVMVKDNNVVLAGEITTSAVLSYETIVHKVAAKLGYKVEKIYNLIGLQSIEIGAAIENNGAGDQGIMFGYATKETESMLPFGFDLANKIIKTIEKDIETNLNSPFVGDAKTQVTVDLDTNTVHTILISACYKESYNLDYIKKYLTNMFFLYQDVLIINPAGPWHVGGPTSDCGLTGRKIVCDQYGGYKPVGGGAFSGKDPTKVDRSASYMARVIAKELLLEYNLDWVEIQLAYAISMEKPVSIYVSTSDTNKDKYLTKIVNDRYDLSPNGIIKYLNLLKIDYEKLSEGCHYYNNF